MSTEKKIGCAAENTVDMRVNIAGIEWKNPVTTASGTFG